MIYNRKQPKRNYPHCHWTKQKKAKKAFETLASANKYINDLHLDGYTAYVCPVCCKWHIGHKKDEQAENT